MTEQRHEDAGRVAGWAARRRASRERERSDQEHIDWLLSEYPVDPDRYPPAKTQRSGPFGFGWGSGGGDWSLFGGDWGGFGGDGGGGGGGCGGGGG